MTGECKVLLIFTSISFDHSPSRKLIHYLVHSSQLTNENEKITFSIIRRDIVVEMPTTIIPASPILASSPIRSFFLENYPLQMPGTFSCLLQPARTWLTGYRLELRMGKDHRYYWVVGFTTNQGQIQMSCLNSKLFINYSQSSLPSLEQILTSKTSHQSTCFKPGN